jgi:hypothetical protein
MTALKLRVLLCIFLQGQINIDLSTNSRVKVFLNNVNESHGCELDTWSSGELPAPHDAPAENVNPYKYGFGYGRTFSISIAPQNNQASLSCMHRD